MRMIKEGKIKELPKEVETKCEYCGCVFAYDKEDVHHGMTMYPDCRSVDFVVCPFCGKSIEVDNIWKN